MVSEQSIFVVRKVTCTLSRPFLHKRSVESWNEDRRHKKKLCIENKLAKRLLCVLFFDSGTYKKNNRTTHVRMCVAQNDPTYVSRL